MGATPAVAVLHPGQMGAAVAGRLHDRGVPVWWSPSGRGHATAARAAEAGIDAAPDLDALLAECDVVLSICPPAYAEDVVGEVTNRGYTGSYVDANAISPQRSERIAALVHQAGGTFVDGGIIGPPPTPQRATSLYLSGPTSPVAAVADLFAGTPVRAQVLPGAAVGAASALKMAFASYQKIRRALAGVAHALAAEYSLTQELLAEGQGTALAEVEQLPSVAGRAWRWVPEMQEIADTMEAAALPPNLTRSAAEVFRRWESDKDTELALDEVLAQLSSDRADPAYDGASPEGGRHLG